MLRAVQQRIAGLLMMPQLGASSYLLGGPAPTLPEPANDSQLVDSDLNPLMAQVQRIIPQTADAHTQTSIFDLTVDSASQTEDVLNATTRSTLAKSPSPDSEQVASSALRTVGSQQVSKRKGRNSYNSVSWNTFSKIDNVLGSLPPELLRIIFRIVGEYIIATTLSGKESWNLLLVDKLFYKHAVGLVPAIAATQAYFYSGKFYNTYENGLPHAILQSTRNGRILLNPYFDLHHHMFFILSAIVTHEDLDQYIRPYISILSFTLDPKEPVHVQGKVGIAYFCGYCRCPLPDVDNSGPSPDSESALVLRNPKIIITGNFTDLAVWTPEDVVGIRRKSGCTRWHCRNLMDGRPEKSWSVGSDHDLDHLKLIAKVRLI